MIIGVDLQLGARDQVVYMIDEKSNEVLGRFPIPEVGKALCNLYFKFPDANKIVISGPEAISRKVEEDIYKTGETLYNHQKINIELI